MCFIMGIKMDLPSTHTAYHYIQFIMFANVNEEEKNNNVCEW